MSEAIFEPVRLREEGTPLEATFLPSVGMLCSSLRHQGAELLAQNAGVDAYARRGKTMGIPLLYPWANRLAGFDYSVAGRTVKIPHDPTRIALAEEGLPIHGIVGGRLAWVLTRAPSSTSQCLAARLSWNELDCELFELFPFHHDLHYRARLADGRLEVEVAMHACGTDLVPVAFGFHPYLSLPGTPRERWVLQLPPMRHLALDSDQIPIGPGRTFPARSFELARHEFDDGFDHVAEPAYFSAAAPGRRIELEFQCGYPCAQVFAPQGRPFVCFEPMTAPTNALRSGSGLRLLAPGEWHRARFVVSVHDVDEGMTR